MALLVSYTVGAALYYYEHTPHVLLGSKGPGEIWRKLDNDGLDSTKSQNVLVEGKIPANACP